MSNRLELEITAKDLVSNALGNWLPQWRKTVGNLFENTAVKSPIAGVGGDARAKGEAIGRQLGEGTQSGMRSMFAGFDLGQLLKADLALKTFNKILGIVQAIPGYLTSSLQQAVDSENATIGAASSLSRSMNLSLDAAGELVKSMQKSIAGIAADLPGTTEDYSSILTSVTGSISRILKDDAKMFESVTTDITKRVGLMAAETHYDPFMTANSVNKLIGGQSTLKQILDNDVFEKVPDFKVGMNKGLEQLGLTALQWQEATEKQRLAVVTYALQFATPESKINALKQTASAIIEGWKSSLFDPQVGVFGVRNELKSRNGRSVFEAFSQFLKSLDELKEAVLPILNGMGFSDPMAVFVDLFDFLRSIAEAAKRIISGGNSIDFSNIGEKVAEWFSTVLLPGLANLRSNVINGISGFLSSIDWALLGGALGQFFVRLPGIMLKEMLSFPVSDFARLILTLITSIAKFLGGVILGQVTAAADVFLKPILEGLAAAGKWLYDSLVGSSGLLTNPIGFITKAITDNVSLLSQAFQGLVNVITGTIDAIKSMLGMNKATPTIAGVQNSAEDAAKLAEQKFKDAEKLKQPTTANQTATANAQTISETLNNTVNSGGNVTINQSNNLSTALDVGTLRSTLNDFVRDGMNAKLTSNR